MIIICGGGIIGLSIARELLKRGADDIIILEKEKDIGFHASGRNSGVLHAGIYYTPDSLKARLCLKGNLLMKEFCRNKGIPVLETGKVIVTKNLEELKILEELYVRAKRNGAVVKLIDEKELKEVEPYAKTVERALYSPLTAVVDSKRVLKEIEKELIKSGKVRILKGVKYEKLLNNSEIKTSIGNIKFNFFINSAGVYADRIAHSFDVGLKFKILPFKGTYKRLVKEKSYIVRGNVYPVPDIRNPFLGVHFTKGYDGVVYVGPTAIPAFGRENYGVLKGIGLEAISIMWRNFVLFIVNNKFRNVALTEPRKFFEKIFFKDVSHMLKDISVDHLIPSRKIGIRPQLVNWESKELVMDFLVIKDSNSLHILNAVSPAFTSAFAFAEYLVENYMANGGLK